MEKNKDNPVPQFTIEEIKKLKKEWCDNHYSILDDFISFLDSKKGVTTDNEQPNNFFEDTELDY